MDTHTVPQRTKFTFFAGEQGTQMMHETYAGGRVCMHVVKWSNHNDQQYNKDNESGY